MQRSLSAVVVAAAVALASIVGPARAVDQAELAAGAGCEDDPDFWK